LRLLSKLLEYHGDLGSLPACGDIEDPVFSEAAFALEKLEVNADGPEVRPMKL
jgi:hypothetical protein